MQKQDEEQKKIKEEKVNLLQQNEQLQEENENLASNLDKMQAEIDQLNIALLHQQKLSSQKNKTKQVIREEFKLELETSLNNLNNLEIINRDLVQEINYLKIDNEELTQEVNELVAEINTLRKENYQLNNLLKNKQSFLNLSELILNHKEPLLIVGGISIVGYLVLKE